MKSTEIQHNVQSIIDNFSKKEFIYDLLIAYGISKTSVTRLKKGDYNLSKIEGEILYKKKIFFKVAPLLRNHWHGHSEIAKGLLFLQTTNI